MTGAEPARSTRRYAVTSKADWIEEADVLSLFPTYVWRTQCKPELCERIKRRTLDSLGELNPRLAEIGVGEGWQSDARLHELAAHGELVSCVLSSSRTILRFLKIGYDAVEITGCWANVGRRGASHAMHTHPNNFLSGVYYVQTSPGAETINFHDPRSQASVLRPPVTELSGRNADQVVVKVKDGTLLMFPSYLPHSVSPSESDELRISISFNVMFSMFGENLSGPMWESREG